MALAADFGRRAGLRPGVTTACSTTGGSWNTLIPGASCASSASFGPTLVVVGEHDPSTPVAAARAIAERIPGAVLHIVPDASHMAPLEKPSQVNDILQGFLAAH